MGLRTKAVHAGEVRTSGGVTTPIYRSSTYELGEPERFDDIRYIRLNNTPNQHAVESKLDAILGGHTLLTPSGTAAIWLALMGTFSAGDELLVARQIYGGTRKILDDLAAQGLLAVRTLDIQAPETWEVTERTRGIYVESLANPWMSIPDLEAVVTFAKAHGLLSFVDNTLLTPVYYQPLAHGFDCELHSASKHMNGHSDLVAGVVACRDAEHLDRLRRRANLVGMCPDPEACALLQRGLKTMALRVRAQSESALALARHLAGHPDVERVHFPLLEGDPSHARARAIGGAGTLLTFVPRRLAKGVVARLELATEAPSLGGVETLVTRPATTSHTGLPAAVRAEMGIHDEMIRVSLGVEDVEDIIADFDRALAG